MTPSIWQLLIVLIICLSPLIVLIFVKNSQYKELSGNQKYAGFWYRFLAGIIDLIILYVVLFLLGILIGLIFPKLFYSMTEGSRGIGFIISLFYYALFQSSSKQATPGMMAFGIKICDKNLQKVNFWRLVLRYFATILSNLTLGIGFFMIGWTKRKQGLHDMIAKTIHLKN
jgi:uncharacterized RDD family membrane protein YckC